MLSHEILSQRRPSRGGVFLAAPGTGYVPDRYAAPRHRRETDKRSATRQLPTRHPVNTPHPRHRRETDKPSAPRRPPSLPRSTRRTPASARNMQSRSQAYPMLIQRSTPERTGAAAKATAPVTVCNSAGAYSTPHFSLGSGPISSSSTPPASSSAAGNENEPSGFPLSTARWT